MWYFKRTYKFHSADWH